MLAYAKSLGDYLLVCIDTDRRVKELKGPTRPIHTEYERKLLLEHLKSVDEVKFFDSNEELIAILQDYNADIMVKGSDWQGKSSLSAKYCKEVKFYDRIDKYSTTNTIQNIINRR